MSCPNWNCLQLIITIIVTTIIITTIIIVIIIIYTHGIPIKMAKHHTIGQAAGSLMASGVRFGKVS